MLANPWNGSGLDNESPTAWLSHSDNGGGVEHEEGAVEDSEGEMALAFEWCTIARLASRCSARSCSVGCNGEIANNDVFDGNSFEGDAVRKKLIREKWLNGDRGVKTRERLVAASRRA